MHVSVYFLTQKSGGHEHNRNGPIERRCWPEMSALIFCVKGKKWWMEIFHIFFHRLSFYSTAVICLGIFFLVITSLVEKQQNDVNIRRRGADISCTAPSLCCPHLLLGTSIVITQTRSPPIMPEAIYTCWNLNNFLDSLLLGNKSNCFVWSKTITF